MSVMSRWFDKVSKISHEGLKIVKDGVMSLTDIPARCSTQLPGDGVVSSSHALCLRSDDRSPVTGRQYQTGLCAINTY